MHHASVGAASGRGGIFHFHIHLCRGSVEECHLVSLIWGAKVDYTPDARLMDVCYRVEATDATGVVIRVYGPICVPKYTGKR